MSDNNKTPRVVLGSAFFWAPVALKLPGDDGETEVVNLRACFHRLPKSERRLMRARVTAHHIKDADLKPLLLASKWMPSHWMDRVRDASDEQLKNVLTEFRITDEEILNRVLKNWEIRDVDSALVPYTEAMRDQLCEDWDGLLEAFIHAYYDAIKGQDAEKNSATPSATT